MRLVLEMPLLLLLLLLPNSVLTDDAVCALSCASVGGGPFEAGHQYQYQYQAQVTSRSLATPSQESRIDLTTDIIITANTPCDLKLQIVNVAVEDVAEEDSQWFKEAVQQHDLHFNFQEGRIEYLCPHDDEDVVATNFKRGILSAFQMKVIDVTDNREVLVDESDVSGMCETRYILSNQNDLVVSKAKHNCHSNGYFPYIPHSHYSTNTFSLQLPFFRRDQSCHMIRREGLWEFIECMEDIRIDGPSTASSDNSSLASITVLSSLSLQAESERAQQNFSKGGYPQRKEPLLMDIEGALRSAESRNLQNGDIRAQIDTTLENLYASVTDNSALEEQRPHAFSKLVSLLGHLQKGTELDEIWDTYSSQKGYREFLLDALMLCEHSHCIHLVSQLAKEDSSAAFSFRVMNWLTGLHFHVNIDPKSVAHIMDMAQVKKDLVTQAVMAVSSMVYRLCQQDPYNCRLHAQPFLKYVREQMGDSCGYRETREQHEHVKMLLRALGNAGIFPDENFPEKCYMNKTLMPELRVTALQSYRRVGCTFSEAPWKILEDAGEKVEVRVAAYLALIPCATSTPGFFSRIQRLLEQEEVNQVGSYIWTHVYNLVESPGASDLDHELAKLAKQHTLPAKFSTNAFRSSKNYRYAQFSEILNLGGNIDSDVIFTTDSYIPRQVSVNMTLDLLDRSFNFLEIGGDFSGIEDIIERYFGKDGYFGNEEILTVLESLRPKKNIIRDDKIQEFEQLYEKSVNEIDNAVNEEPKASVYIRVFGNEVVYLENLLRSNPIQFLHHLIQEFSTPKSFQIMDQEYISPTILGFPLRLKINATGSVNFNKEETFHRRGTEGVLLEGRISPSAVMALDETLLVDGCSFSSGLRRTTIQIARTHFGGKFAVQNGQIVEAQIDFPSNEVTKVSSSVKIALYKNSEKNWEEQRTDTPVKKWDYCSSESFSDVLGFKMCNSLIYGTHTIDDEIIVGEPYNMEFKVTKTDTFNQYKLFIKKQANVLEAIFDTPGSVIDRKVHFLFNVRPNNAGGYIVIRGMGYGIEGQYENIETSKILSLHYHEDSKVHGELILSLKKQEEGISCTYIPKLSFTFGSSIIKLEGNLRHRIQEDLNGLEVLWSLGGTWNKMDSMQTVGQIFGLASGNLNINEEESGIQVEFEYGMNRTMAHSVSLAMNLTRLGESKERYIKGSLSLQSSQAEANMEMEYQYQPGYAEVNTNITVNTTQIASYVIMKDLLEGDSRDFQVKMSFVSQQLNMNYLCQAIYKVSDNAFQAEAELNLDSLLSSKFVFAYVFENEPLHLLLGLHLHFNDFVIEVGHQIDLSHVDHAVIVMSYALGPVVAAFHFEVDYNQHQPFNVTMEMYGGYDAHRAGISFYTTSDQDWQTFTGRSNLKWFDWSYSIEHQAVLMASKKSVKFILESSRYIEITTEMSPNLLLQFLMWNGPDNEDPALQVAVEKKVLAEYEIFQANITTGEDCLFQTVIRMTREKIFSYSLRLLKSEAIIYGKYSLPDHESFEGSAQATVILPSGQVFTSNLSLTHTYDGIIRNIVVSCSFNDDVINGHISVIHHDTWFKEDVVGFNFTLTTPFPQFQKFGVAFEKSSDPSSGYFAEIELDEFKIRGDAQLGDQINFDAKLQFDVGDICDSHFDIYHKYDGQQYMTKASMALTKAYNPWIFEVNTTFDFSGMEKSNHIKLNFHSPMLTTPFHLYGMYNVTEELLSLRVQTGMEEEISLSVFGQKESSLNTKKLYGLTEFDTPWTEPVHVNITIDQAPESFSLYIDFHSSLKHISSWVAEFDTNYSSPEDTKAHLYLSHNELQITMDLVHNFTMSGLKQQLEGSINTLTVTYNIDTVWDEDFTPRKAKGHVSLLNMFDHNLDLTFSHTEEASLFITQLSVFWDGQIFKVDHRLEMQQLQEWSSALQITLPGHGEFIVNKFTVKAEYDLSTINSNFNFTSPWTKEYSAKFVMQETGSVMNYKFDMVYGGAAVLGLILELNGLFNWYQSDLALQVTSLFFDDYKMKWKHNFESESLTSVDVTYGSSFFIKAKSHLKFSQGWHSHDFLSYDFIANANITDWDVQFMALLNIDSQFNGKLESTWGDYFFSLASGFLDGIIFSVIAGDSTRNFQSDLMYEKGKGDLPNLHFCLARNETDIIKFHIVFETLYPKLDTLISLAIFSETNNTLQTAQLKVTADLASINNYAFKGSIELESDLEGFEDYRGELDICVKINSKQSWDGHLNGLINYKEWKFGAKMNGSLELSHKFHLECGTEYYIAYNDEIFNKTGASLMIMATEDAVYQMRYTIHVDQVGPHWSLFVYYDNKYGDLKGFVMPGNSKKYEVACRLSSKILTLSAQRIDEDGSKFQFLQGNMSWIIRKIKQLITINFNSDIDYISKITGQLTVQQRRGLAITAKLKVDEENFLGTLRYISPKPRSASRIIIKVDNDIFMTFRINAHVDFSVIQNGFITHLTVDLDEEQGWITGNLKVSLPESYIWLRMPFSEMETFNLTVTVKAMEEYGLEVIMKVPQFCFNFTGVLDKTIQFFMINMNMQLNCGEEALFDFIFKYNIDKNSFVISCKLDVYKYGSIFILNVAAHIKKDEVYVEIRTELYPQLSLGLDFIKQLREEHQSLKLQVYDPSFNTTYLLIKNSLSSIRADVINEQPEDRILSLEPNYLIHPRNIRINTSYSHSLFGFMLNIELTGKANFMDNFGNMEMHFTSDLAFNHTDLSFAYDLREETKNGNFKLLTTNGNVEGEVKLKNDDNIVSFIADMSSSLHTFQNYHLEFIYESEGPSRTFKLLSVQDDVEFQLNGAVHLTDEESVTSLTFLTAFEKYERFDFELSHPVTYFSENYYKAKFTLTSYGREHVIDIKHSHHRTWKKQQTEIMLTIPNLVSDAFTFLLMYDFLGGQASVILSSPQGLMGVEGTWELSDLSIAFTFASHLTFFDLGEYNLAIYIPLDLSHKWEICLSRYYTDSDFASQLITEEYFSKGLISFIINEKHESVNKTYSVGYEIQDFLKIEGQFENWDWMSKWTFSGKPFPAMSGSFEVKTNIQGYRIIDGSWNMGQRDQAYLVQVNVDMKQKGSVTFSAVFDIQSEGLSASWESIKLNILFESPFTLTHHLQAHYQLSTLSLAAYYQYGLDTFHILWTLKFSNNTAAVMLNGNIPVQGISTFSVNFKFEFLESYSGSFVASIEETVFQSNFELSPDWKVGSVMTSLISPFVSPLKAELIWFFLESPINLKATYSAGRQSGELKMTLVYVSNSAHLDFQIKTSFNGASKLTVDFFYNISNYVKLQAAISVSTKHHFLKINADLMISNATFLLKFTGLIEMFGVSGSGEIELGKTGDIYKGNISGKISGYETSNVSFLLDLYQFHLSLNYRQKDILKMNVNYYQTNIQFMWTDYLFFKLAVFHKSTKTGHQVDLSFHGFDMKPIRLQASYSGKHKIKFDLSMNSSVMQPLIVNITYSSTDDIRLNSHAVVEGKEYNLTGRAKVKKRQSSFEIYFDSSEDSSDPIIVEAMYDLKKFMLGKMNSVMRLASVTFDWGEHLQLNVTGMRNQNQTKINLKMSTPFSCLPHLLLDFEGEFTYRHSLVNLTWTVFIEWSQQVNSTGFLKLEDRKLDFNWTLTTSSLEFEKLIICFQLQTGHMEASLVFNKDKWRCFCDFEFSPIFSVVCSVETPISDFEIISLSLSVGTQNNKLSVQIELTWPEAQILRVHIQVEKTNIEINLLTPWDSLRVGSFMATQKTENEKSVYSSVLQWDIRKIETSLLFSPLHFQFVSKYDLSSVVLGLVRVDFSFFDKELKSSMKIQTPFTSMKLLEAMFHLELQQFSAKFTINEITNSIKGIFSINGGKFEADIPLLGDFKWKLEAKNQWMEMGTQVIFTVAKENTPFIITFSYEIQPQAYLFKSIFDVVSDRKWISVGAEYGDGCTINVTLTDANLELNVAFLNNEETYVELKFESQHWKLQSLNLNVTANYGGLIEFYNASVTASVKFQNKDLLHYHFMLGVSVNDDFVFMDIEFAFDQNMAHFEFSCIFPMFNMFFEEAKISFVMTQGGEQKYKLLYETVFPDTWSSSRLLMVESPEWDVCVLVVFSEHSLSVSYSFPDSSAEHSLLVVWSKDSSFENFMIGTELNSPYLKDDSLQLNLSFSFQQFYGSLNFSISYGIKKTDINGHFQYGQKEHKINGELYLTSDWIGKYSLRANIHWKKDVNVSVILNILEKEHIMMLNLDITDYILKLSSKSSWLSFEEIKFMGKVNSDFQLSNMNYEVKLTTGDREIFVDAKFENINLEHINSYIIIKQNEEEVFTMSAVLYFYFDRIDFDFDMYSVIPDLNNNLEFRYKDDVEERIVSGRLTSILLQNKEVTLYILNNKLWRNAQVFHLSLPYYFFSLEIDMNKGTGGFTFRSEDSSTYVISNYNSFEENSFEISVRTSFAYCEALIFEKRWSLDSFKNIHIAYVWDGQEIVFQCFADDDDTFGKTFTITLTTPFEGFEKYALRTPYFQSNGQHFGALFEYPSGKVGVEMRLSYKSFLDTYFICALYLPFEKYEIISMQYIILPGDFKIEARVGKVGFTLSLKVSGKTIGEKLEAVMQINEYSIRAIFRESSMLNKTRFYFHVDLEPQELVGNLMFHVKLEYETSERVFFVVKSEQEEFFKIHMAWNSDKVLAITTPRIYPGCLTVNFESAKELDDYHLQLSFDPEDIGTLESYGFHVHREILESGHHLSVSGENMGNNFLFEGTLSVNSYHLNDSLIFELNKNRLGYRILFQREPGFFYSTYTSDVYLVLPTQTLHYKTNATSSLREFDVFSSFTWNENDLEIPPLFFKLNYFDESIFGETKEYISAVFSHPDIEDIIFHGNVTQSQNSPLYGLAELVDRNSPERNIVMMVDVQPVTDDGEHSIQVNISQSSSGFVFAMDAQVMESVFTKGDYTFRYWSLAEEKWEELQILTAVNASNSGYDFAADILSSLGKWGYSCAGDIHSFENLATFNIQGSPKEVGEFWKFGATADKYLPNLLVYLDVGKKQQEAYEEGRLRIGFHNPIEMGALLDHQRFGEWSQDGEIGLKLITPYILQFVLEFDPTLDFRVDSFWTHITSPANKILNTWSYDLVSTASVFKQWVLKEAPIAFQSLVNHQTLQTVWDRETSNFDYFINEFNTAIYNISADVKRIWTEFLQPSLHITYNFVISLYEQSLFYFESFLGHVSQQLHQVKELMKEKWANLESQISTLLSPLALWLTDMMEEVWEKMTHQLFVLHSVLSSWLNQLSGYMNTMMIILLDKMNSTLGDISSTLQEYLAAIQGNAQPYMDSLTQAFISYSQEIGTVFSDQCWQSIADKLEIMAATKEGICNTMLITSEFLQIEEYYKLFIYARDVVVEWADDFWTVIKGDFSQLHKAVKEAWESWTLPFAELVNSMQEAVDNLSSQLETQGLYNFMKQNFAELSFGITSAADEYLKFAKESLEAYQRNLSSHIVFDYISVNAGRHYDKIMSTWQKWTEQDRKNLDILERLIFPVIDVAQKLLSDNNYFLDELYVYEPTYGKIRYNQYLPVHWTSFFEAPQWYWFGTISQKELLVFEAQQFLVTGVNGMVGDWEALNHPDAFTHPFTATATIAGQHVTTFDLHHYQFLGSCSYLLAKDFKDDEFEVIGVYKAKDGAASLESVIVHGHRTDVTLHVDGTVETTQAGAKVYSGDDYSALKMPNLLVTCSKILRGCSITVSGKYFNRLAGLLGNYNYELSDETHGPSGERAFDAADLARMWAVSSEPCYQANQAVQLVDIGDAEDVNICLQLFLHNTSPLSNCFHIVDPRPYFRHCINGQGHPALSDEDLNFPCTVVSSYRTQCWTRGFHLPEVEPCQTKILGTCNVSGELLPSGWMHTYENETQGSADIAFIVELSSCNRDRNVQKLFQSLVEQLKRKNIRDVRYAVVTVKGNVTSSTHFMGESDTIIHLSTHNYEGLKDDQGGAAAVISTSKNFKWRLGVSRTIIQISCQACNKGEAVAQALQENDVTYHLITRLNIIMAGASHKESQAVAHKMYGFDKKFVYDSGDYKQFKGNARLRMALQEPEGSCIAAAQTSRGSVFNSYKWSPKKKVQEKKFLSVIGHRVALTSIAPECQECQCINENTGAVLTCRECSSSPILFLPLENASEMVMEENNTVMEDIKRSFKDEFIDKSVAYRYLGLI